MTNDILTIADCQFPIYKYKRDFMNKDELCGRTKKFALDIIILIDELPKTLSGRAIGGQLVRSATSVAANYRAACRSRSRNEFIAKIGGLEWLKKKPMRVLSGLK